MNKRAGASTALQVMKHGFSISHTRTRKLAACTPVVEASFPR